MLAGCLLQLITATCHLLTSASWVGGSAATAGQPPAAPELLLGHFCSILTSLSVSRCGRFVVTTDRDAKARVSVLPPNPMAGAHDIQSYCLAHSGFVTCSAFVAQGGKVRGAGRDKRLGVCKPHGVVGAIVPYWSALLPGAGRRAPGHKVQIRPCFA